jgi:hypothetical protein
MLRALVAVALLFSLAACAASPCDHAGWPVGLEGRPIAVLAVPAGNELAFVFDAEGVQIYACNATAAGYAWSFVAPEATLFFHDHAVGSHYAGPTWEFRDGSTVVGARRAAATPDPTAIPWLLLAAVSHWGDGRMSQVTYVQRLSTVGGIAPPSGCDAAAVGTRVGVPYTAQYAFRKAEDAEED